MEIFIVKADDLTDPTDVFVLSKGRDTWNKLNYVFKKRLLKLGKHWKETHDGKKLVIISAHRTIDQQKELYKKRSKSHATPMGSAHIYGYAVDISNSEKLSNHDAFSELTSEDLKRFKLWKPLYYSKSYVEKWHVEPVETKGHRGRKLINLKIKDDETGKEYGASLSDKDRQILGGSNGSDQGYSITIETEETTEIKKTITKNSTESSYSVGSGGQNESDNFDEDDKSVKVDPHPPASSEYWGESTTERGGGYGTGGSNKVFLEPFLNIFTTASDMKKNNQKTDDLMESYINWWIRFSVVFGSIVAVGMVVFGGIQYMISDIAYTKTSAKHMINNSLFGLAFLILGYLIFKLINPNILNVRLFSDGGLNEVAIENKVKVSRVLKKMEDEVKREDQNTSEQYNKKYLGLDKSENTYEVETIRKIVKTSIKTSGNGGGILTGEGIEPPNYLFSKTTNSMTHPNIHPMLKHLFNRFTDAVKTEMNLTYGSDYKISQSGRSKADHLKNLQNGISKRNVSKHCWGGAFDIHNIKGYNKAQLAGPKSPLNQMGKIWHKISRESGLKVDLGSVWGGVWKELHDPYHFQLPGNVSQWRASDGRPIFNLLGGQGQDPPTSITSGKVNTPTSSSDKGGKSKTPEEIAQVIEYRTEGAKKPPYLNGNGGENAVQNAIKEFKFWTKRDGIRYTECDSHVKERLKAYWEAAGESTWNLGKGRKKPKSCGRGSDSDAWSGVFISYITKSELANDDHIEYIRNAIEGKSIYKWHNPNTETPQVGDIICHRRNRYLKDSHCDIVISVNGNWLKTIGGNIIHEKSPGKTVSSGGGTVGYHFYKMTNGILNKYKGKWGWRAIFKTGRIKTTII